MMKKGMILFFLLVAVAITGCKKDPENGNPDDSTTYPQILKLTADKYEIMVGGEDPAILTCEASGGNLGYTWEVDLGDIFALNQTGSQVRFTGSECCVGDKLIKCTVSNDRGSVTDTIIVHIFIP